MKKILSLFILAIVLLSSCSEYQAVLKSKDNELKYKKAKEYYDAGKYAKALTLLEGLINVYRGTDKAEEVYYQYSQCHFQQGDYIMAGYYFKNFAQTYRNSKYAEEAMYMTAYCNYLNSPKPSLDQKETREALTNFELFLAKYPESKHKADVERYTAELQAKLQEKTYEAARQYYILGYYQAAIVAVKTAIQDAPSSAYKEQLMLLDIQSKYEYASNSIAGKQYERYDDVTKSYYAFVDLYPQSENLKEVTRYHERAKEYLEKHKDEAKN